MQAFCVYAAEKAETQSAQRALHPPLRGRSPRHLSGNTGNLMKLET